MTLPQQDIIVNVPIEYEALCCLLDALGEARSAGAWDHWNADSRGWVNDAIRALYIAEEEARPDA